MKHIHMDEFAKLKSPVHAMDPRAKALSFFIFIFITVSLKQPVFLAVALIFWMVMIAVARIPLSHVLTRLFWILPFAGFLIILFPFITPGDTVWTLQKGIITLTATAQGVERATMLLLRVVTSVLIVVTLMATTRFNNLMRAFEDLKVPGVILQMVEFTIRYIFVMIDELKRMRRARKSRGFAQGRNLWHSRTVKTLAQLVGVMFIRAYERGDRVYIAMLSRGFTGKIYTLTDMVTTGKDYFKASAIVLVAVVLLVIDRGWI